VGHHFIIFAEYVKVDPDGEGAATAATGSVSEGTDKDGDTGPMATLKAPTTKNESSSNGQTVWLKVTVEMMDVVTQSQTHNITITFDAYTK
jgi:hypothetical protein